MTELFSVIYFFKINPNKCLLFEYFRDIIKTQTNVCVLEMNFYIILK